MLGTAQKFQRSISPDKTEGRLTTRVTWIDSIWILKDGVLDVRATDNKWGNWKHGKTSSLPRLTAWHGDSESSYSYSGIKSKPNPWNKGLLYMKSEIERVTCTSFNSVLLNWYRDGDDHLGWHADNERELGTNPTIASLSLGETRDFVLRLNNAPSEKFTIPLEHGSLLDMYGDMQKFWQHSLPKRKKSESLESI